MDNPLYFEITDQVRSFVQQCLSISILALLLKQEGRKCYDWFFCTQEVTEEKVMNAIKVK